MTIIVTIVLLFLGGSLGLLATSENRMAQREEQAMQAYYLARSGADAMAQYIIDYPSVLEDISGLNSERVYLGQGQDEYFTVRVDRNEAGLVVINSTGSSKGSQASIQLALDNDGLFESAVVGLSSGTSSSPAITITGNPTIKGDVATNSSLPGSVRISGNIKLDGTLYVSADAEDPKKVVNQTGHGKINIVPLSSPMNYPKIVFPDPPTGLTKYGNKTDNTTIMADGHYDSIKTSKTLKISLGGGTRIIRVGTLDLSQDVELLDVSPNGRLILYVENTITGLNGNSKINWTPGGKNDPKSLTIYYAGTNTLTINGNFKMTANIVVDRANVDISGNIDLNGNLFSNGPQVEISGNIEQSLVYVPKGRVSLPGNSKLGAVIANTLSITGNSDIVIPKGAEFAKSFPDGIFGSDTIGSGLGYSRGLWSAMR